MNCASTPSARWRWTRCSRPTPVIPARRWRWRRWPIALWQHFLRFDPSPSDLAESRPLRAVGRPCVDAAVLAAASDRREERSTPSTKRSELAVGVARRYQAVPAARQHVPRPSGVSLDVGRRDHHRAARPGRGDERRHGDRRALDGQRTSTARASSCSTTTSTRCAATAA